MPDWILQGELVAPFSIALAMLVALVWFVHSRLRRDRRVREMLERLRESWRALPAQELRDRLLASLLSADPGLLLRELNSDIADLVGPDIRIVLVTAHEGTAPETVTEVVRDLVKRVRSGDPPTHFVVVGGGPEMTSVKAAAPFIEPVPMGFHVLGQPSFSRALPLLATLAPEKTPPLTPQQVSAALARGQAQGQEPATGAKPRGRYGVTAAITVVCAVLTILSYSWGGSPPGIALWWMGANSSVAVRQGEVWRLFSSAFLHADAVHFAVNMFALWSFGPWLELLIGSRRYVLLYAASALGGSLTRVLLNQGGWSVGASGAIWGLMTAHLGIVLWPAGLLTPSMAKRLRRQAWSPVIVNTLYSMRPGIDIAAHFGGGIVGFVLAATVLKRGLVPLENRGGPTDLETRPHPFLTIAASIVGGTMVFAVAAALIAGQPWRLGAPPLLQRTLLADTGVSVDVPALISHDMRTRQQGTVRIFAFGTFPATPVVFEIIVVPIRQELTPAELDQFLERERKGLEKGPANALSKGPARPLTLGGHPTLLVEHSVKGVNLVSYFTVVGAREVLVRAYSTKNRLPSWAGIEEKVAATVTVRP